MIKQKIKWTNKYLLEKKVRIDKYLTDVLNITRSYVNVLINHKLIYVNEQLVTKPGWLLKTNDEIILYEEEIKKTNNNLTITFKIIYEDEYLMVIYKPKGLLCHPTSFLETDTLINQLQQYYLNMNYQLNLLNEMRNGLVHRLDKDTSGLLLIAKQRDVFNKLKIDIETKKTKRFYYAIVLNKFFDDTKQFQINLPIDHTSSSTKMKISKSGKEAITNVRVIKNFKNTSLVECELLTGRTHQIRIHLASINHPIYNDALYGNKINALGQYLMAYKIIFNHPVYNKIMQFEIKIDDWMQEKINEDEKEL